jgi:hypothetical protein
MFVTDAIWSRGSQSQNSGLARQFIAAHDGEIHKDPRFHDVRLVDATIRGGCIGVIGSVASDTDNQDLRRILNGVSLARRNASAAPSITNATMREGRTLTI